MSKAMAPYRPAQGTYARAGAAGVMLLLALFGCYRVFQLIVVRNGATFSFVGMPLPYATLWAGGLFVVAGLVVFLFTFGPETGLQALDSKTHALIDLLIDTEAELNKVSWPGREELVRSTTAVLVSILLVGCFLFAADWIFGQLMRVLRVLPI